MDAVLQQMLVFENQASQLVQEAEARAAAILDHARKEALELDKRLEAELAAEVESLLRTRTGDEDIRCKQELEAARNRIQEEFGQLMARVPGAAVKIAQVLAYPQASV